MPARLMIFAALAAAWCSGAAVGQSDADQPAPMPVYVYLFAHFEDHINTELSEWRIREVMETLTEAHREHPDLVAAVGEFYGADSEVFAAREEQSGIVGLIRHAIAEGWYDVGYHGAHEPTYATSQAATRSMAGKGWSEIYTATRTFYTAHRDLRTGRPDPTAPGGIALMADVFGEPTVISGAAGMTNPPGMLALSDLSGCRVFFGFTDHGPAVRNPGYVPGVLEIRRIISPSPETSADLFWYIGCLITSSHPVSQQVGVVGSELPPDLVKLRLANIDRTRVAVPHMIYGTKFVYARASPTQYGYRAYAGSPEADLDAARLPPALLLSEDQRLEKLGCIEENVRWLVEEYFPANPGSRSVGNRLLLELTMPYAGQAVSAAELDEAASFLLDEWTDRPPSFVPAGKRYLSLAQLFKLLATALKEYAATGSLPDSLLTEMVYGPIGMWDEIVHAAEQEVSQQTVIEAAASLAFGPEHQPGAAEPPGNRVPLNVTVGEVQMQAAQFLRLMAEAYRSLRAGETAPVLHVRPTNVLPQIAVPWQRVHPMYEETPSAYGYLQLWTVKPAQFPAAMGTN